MVNLPDRLLEVRREPLAAPAAPFAVADLLPWQSGGVRVGCRLDAVRADR